MKRKMTKILFAAFYFNVMSSYASALTCTNLNTFLSKGYENNNVLALQQFLVESGYLSVKPNGYFGGNTEKAVVAFQRKQKIVAAGFVGPATRAKIKEISCSSTTTFLGEKVLSGNSTSTNDKIVNGTKDRVVATTTTEQQVTPTVQEAPTIYVKTRIPLEVTPETAVLSGSGGIDGEKHWFEWGKVSAMNNVTPQTVASTTYSYKITGLSPGTAYVFRAVTSVASSTERKGEVAYGNSLYFTTPNKPADKLPPPTVSISSTGLAVNPNGSARVTWVSANVNVCSFAGGEDGGTWTRLGSLSGEYITQSITKSTFFGISCQNSVGYTVTNSITLSKVVK